MLRAIQSLGSVSGVVSSPLHRWKSGRRRGGFSFISVSIESASDSRRAAPSFVFPVVSTRRTARLGGAFRMSTIRSDSNLDAAAASSSSPSSPSTSFQSSGHIHKIKFCQLCGGPTKHEIPAGEEKMRAICTLCGKIAYQNPKMVVGCLVEHENRVLLCKRKIQPSYGLWTLPAGYLEIGESAAEGAIRETWEEAGAEVEVLSPFAQLDIPRIGQTYIIFRARMKKPHFLPGPESLECRLFSLDEIPFSALAFSSMMVTLNLYIEDVKMGKLKFHYGTINKRVGSSPSDVHGYTLDYHLIS